LADSLQEPLHDDSVMTHSVVPGSVIVTLPVGVVSEYCGETVTDTTSACSCP
jgi:hypothetical protein